MSGRPFAANPSRSSAPRRCTGEYDPAGATKMDHSACRMLSANSGGAPSSALLLCATPSCPPDGLVGLDHTEISSSSEVMVASDAFSVRCTSCTATCNECCKRACADTDEFGADDGPAR